MPITATLMPGPTFHCRSGENMVIPAHSNGAAAAGSSPSGMETTMRSSTTMCVE